MEEKMSRSIANAIDYKGFPADKSKTGGWVPAALILGIEFCERLSTMGIAVNLVTYLIGTMHLSSATSANIVTDFMGTSFLLCLVGGFLADTFLGRYKTIAIFALVQTLGTCMLAISTRLPQVRPPPCEGNPTNTCKKASTFQMGILYISLYLIALGTGGLKSSVSGFGTDQFDENDEKEKAQMAYFFNRYKKSLGSPIVHILQVIVAATRKRRLQVLNKYDKGLVLYEDYPESSRIRHTDQFRFLDKAAIVTDEDYGSNGSVAPNHWKLCPVTRVEEVKMVIKLLPIWATTIIFWTTYAQMITFSVEQASTMERTIGGFQIPAGSLTVFFVAAILITLAVYDRLIMPLWKSWKGKPGFTYLQRIAIGLFLSTVGMAAAALVEVKRLSVARAAGTQSTTSTLPITVFLLIPQFFLVGSGEAFIYTGQLDFFITQSPKGMKTMSTGLFLTTLSLGFFVSSFIVSVVKRVTRNGDGQGWVGDNINNGRLDCFYGLVTILSFINFGLYLLCAAWYKPQTGRQKEDMQMECAVKSSLDEEC
ncbi:protein NRT1/ PTR FAMILY 6.2-like isoform X2 [Cornus florida]|uniref:protein NRT1/ PTR FAMILY 6.2-like isoform X2 n=1 Tax=Cornus florida TaxID=4283 RepID=UPI00289F5EB1|nr:protein NRT1/ PTR FAMILY 6.2-like isoform X2 [Cornus florida]